MKTITHDDLVILTSWLAEDGYSAKGVAYAVEKPWKFTRELSLAKAVQKHDEGIHHPQESSDGSGWICAPEWVDGVEQFCDWTWEPTR